MTKILIQMSKIVILSFSKAFTATVLSLVILLHLSSCTGGTSQTGNDNSTIKEYSHPSEDILTKYRTQTPYTDPGEYAYLFEVMPDSYKALCALIKMQLIHPMEAAEMPEVFPKDMLPEDGRFPTVSDMLAELVARDPEGLTLNREPEDKLLVACYHHGLLLASILRYQGIPVRLRAGYARYYEEQLNVRFSHIICEVWNENEGQWDILDPDRNIQYLSREKFEYPSEVWQNYINNDLPRTNYIGSLGQSEAVFIHSLLLDMAFVLGNERNYWHTPEFIFFKEFNIKNLEAEQINVLNRIANLMRDPGKNILQLEELYEENLFIQSHKRDIHKYYERD